MTELEIYRRLVLVMFVLAALSFVSLLFVTAPYGRHVRPGWGPTIPARSGWVIMESPAVVLFAVIYALGDHAAATIPVLLLLLWQLHYINRTFIYPFRLRAAGKRMPLSIAGMAFTFNCLNAYVNARWVSHFGDYPGDATVSMALAPGTALFLLGLLINLRSDAILLRLRGPGEAGYRIPRGGLFRWISCPNYLGEILAWLGWAVASWSLAGLAFAVFTLGNLVPRALAHHRWYLDRFPDYPRDRRALVPYLL